MYHDKKFTNIDVRNMYGCEEALLDLPIDYPDVDAMVSLEIFAGCGGKQHLIKKICFSQKNFKAIFFRPVIGFARSWCNKEIWKLGHRKRRRRS